MADIDVLGVLDESEEVGQAISRSEELELLTEAMQSLIWGPMRNCYLPYEGNHPMGDLYVEKSVRLIGENFLQAVDEPSNLDARSGMALSATLGGLAFSNCGVALVQALEYPIGNQYQCAHGAGIGIVLPKVFKFLGPAREERIPHIGHLLGVEGTAEATISEVIRLRRESGLPERLRDVGAKHGDIPSLAESAGLLERLMVLTANRPTLENLRSIYETSC